MSFIDILSLVGVFSFSDMLCHLEGGRDDERRPPRNTICMMEYVVLRERNKGRINDLVVHTKKEEEEKKDIGLQFIKTICMNLNDISP